MQKIMEQAKQQLEIVSVFLADRGISAEITQGEIVDDNSLDELESEWKVKLPESLRAYWKTLGDGFDFQYEWKNPNSGREELFRWGLSAIEDINDEREQQLEILETIEQGEGQTSYGIPDYHPEAKTNAKAKFGWLPIFGVGDGGTIICLDTLMPDGQIRCFETFQFTQASDQSIIVAESLIGWLNSWSRFCFSDPAPEGKLIHLSTFLESRSGSFDWSPKLFLPFFNRENA